MDRKCDSALDMIGNTPLFAFCRLAERRGLKAKLLGKLEYLNPFGSVKDRICVSMIRDAEISGRLRPGGVIIEPTSGNTGIGLSAVGGLLGYRVVLTMPETMSMERRRLLKAHGAELALTDGKLGMKGAIARAEELAAATEGGFLPGQFDNPANARAHYEGTGPEIWRDTDGEVAVFVSGVGSGGTITGAGRFLREASANGVRVVAVEPAESPVLSGGQAGPHTIQGIGAGFVPRVLDATIYDEIVQITGEAAVAMVREVAMQEGLLLGISAGAALEAAVRVGARPEYSGKNIVVVIPDSGERYLSMNLFE